MAAGQVDSNEGAPTSRAMPERLIIYEKEEDVKENIFQYLKQVDQLQSKLSSLTDELPKSMQLKQNKHIEKVEYTKAKIQNIFDNTCKKIKDKEMNLLNQLDKIKKSINIKDENDYNTVTEAKNKLNEMRKCLENSLNEWNNKIYNSDNYSKTDRTKRKEFIIKLGDQTMKTFQENQFIISPKIREIESYINNNKSWVSDIEYIHDEKTYNQLLRKIDAFGNVQSNYYFNNLRDEENEFKEEKQQLNAAVDNHDEKVDELGTNEINNNQRMIHTSYWIAKITFLIWYLWVEFYTVRPTKEQCNKTYINCSGGNDTEFLMYSLPFYLILIYIYIRSRAIWNSYNVCDKLVKYLFLAVFHLVFLYILLFGISLHLHFQCSPWPLDMNAFWVGIYFSDVLFMVFILLRKQQSLYGKMFQSFIILIIISYHVSNTQWESNWMISLDCKEMYDIGINRVQIFTHIDDISDVTIWRYFVTSPHFLMYVSLLCWMV